MRAWLLLLAAIVCEVTATLSLKGALDHGWLYAVVVIGYLTSFVLLALVLHAGMPLGVAYGIWGACGVAATAVLAAAFFDERINAVMGLGIVAVMAGVLMVELGSRTEAER